MTVIETLQKATAFGQKVFGDHTPSVTYLSRSPSELLVVVERTHTQDWGIGDWHNWTDSIVGSILYSDPEFKQPFFERVAGLNPQKQGELVHDIWNHGSANMGRRTAINTLLGEVVRRNNFDIETGKQLHRELTQKFNPQNVDNKNLELPIAQLFEDWGSILLTDPPDVLLEQLL